jgi:hypothetical protein
VEGANAPGAELNFRHISHENNILLNRRIAIARKASDNNVLLHIFTKDARI